MRLSNTSVTDSPARLILALALALCCFAVFAASAGAGSLTYYTNSLKSSTGRKEVRQYSKYSCDRGGSKTSFRTKLGKKARECAYRVPVAGPDLSISVIGRLFKSTPRKVKPQAYLSVSLRQGRDGSRYQLLVFPSGRRYQLRKVYRNGKVKYFGKGRAGKKVGGFGQANRLALRVYNGQGKNPRGSAGVLAMVNGHKLAYAVDPKGNQLRGQNATFSIGNKNGGRGARGSFIKLLMRIPDPF